MKKLLPLILVSFLLSGCTVAHFAYVRNLSECDVAIDLVFPEGKVVIPDSIYLPYSSTSHLINSRTPDYMKDSVIAKKLGPNRISFWLPRGSMVMYDKNTSKKLGYWDPETVVIQCPRNQMISTIYFDPNSTMPKKFKQKGTISHITWLDIY